MRLLFLITLLITVVLSSSYVYVTTLAECVTPLHYRVGVFDARFAISEEAAIVALQSAEAVWEELTDRELFILDDTADFTINFIFDDRQAVVFDQNETENRLNTVEEQNEKIKKEFAALEAVFITARDQYEQAVAQYNQEQTALNQQVADYNSTSDVDSAVEAALRQAQQRLDATVATLDADADRLNQLREDLNTLAERGNTLIELYNRSVESFNDRFGESREFTQGDYQGDQINIYTFLDEAELVRVLVHEFGHALGIDHVENSESMMYHLMSDQPTIARLSAEDTQAFFASCGQDTDLKNRLITTITRYLPQ